MQNTNSSLTHQSHPSRREALATALGLAVGPLMSVRAPAQAQLQATYVDETWQDPRRQRAVSMRIRWPQGIAPVGGWAVIVYSHGLGGSRNGGDVWGQAWANAGFVVLHLQHAGSDIEAVRASASSFRDGAALRKLGGPDQLLARLQDVVFVIDEVARRKNDARAADIAWRSVRASAVGVAGHSFGAHTTLGVGGQTYPGNPGLKDPRIAALIALSPTLPMAGDAKRAFAGITVPTLCLTGTLDADVVGNGATPERRAGVFAALPPGNKAMLLLQDADHMTFGGITGRAASILPRQPVTSQLQPLHHALITRVTTDWWRAHLMADSEASARLQNPTGLGASDIWQVG